MRYKFNLLPIKIKGRLNYQFSEIFNSFALSKFLTMRYQDDTRIVMTLDGGGTNFVFSAMQAEKEIITPFAIPAQASTLSETLYNIETGFRRVKSSIHGEPVAISFSFPGPADYELGIIGDLVNLTVFKGGVPLGPYLEEIFKIPVFINNDGDLFAYGEAISGFLPEVNNWLAEAGNPKRFQNLLGVTFGTGFGGGIVLRGELFLGDNSAAGEINRMSNKLYRNMSAEESVSIRGVKRVFSNYSNIPFDQTPSPKEIYEIAIGKRPGDLKAANKAFEELAIVAGNAIADALTLVDGLVVIGGGLAGAWPVFLDRLVEELNQPFATFSGQNIDRLEIKFFNLEDAAQRERFLKGSTRKIDVPGSSRKITYDPEHRSGVGITRLGTSRTIALGAYNFALSRLDSLS
ncbi:MAG: ROK family protein [Bacteroidetes bacterium 38_7]|nr:MAG: ROK family protein [Bacteroidetes bacterium 38_7]